MNAESLRTLPLQPREWSEVGAELDVAGHGHRDPRPPRSAPVIPDPRRTFGLGLVSARDLLVETGRRTET